MKQTIYTIIDNAPLTADVSRMVLWGDVSAFTAPGQFVNLLIDGLYLRRPISVCDLADDRLTLIYKVVGQGTEKMRQRTRRGRKKISMPRNGSTMQSACSITRSVTIP